MSYFVHIVAKELNIVDVEGVWISSNEYFLGDKTSLGSINYSKCTSGSAISNSKFFLSCLCSWDTRKSLPPLLPPLPGRPLPPLLDPPQVTPTGSGTPLCLPPLAAWGVHSLYPCLILRSLQAHTNTDFESFFDVDRYHKRSQKKKNHVFSLYSYYGAWKIVI